jgi:SAM-dependent methyltransferase
MTTPSDWASERGERWRTQLDGMEPTLLPVEEPLIRALELEVPVRIAEVGCGGGGTALNILRSAPAGSIVHGFDISPALIEHARRRLAPDERAVAFDFADMAKAAPPEPYDRLVSRFGVMFFDDAPAAFANLVRWLAPGGRFAFAVWGPLSENPWMTIVRDVVAGFVEVPASDPEAPGAFRYADGGRFIDLLDRAGFAGVEARDWRGALPLGGGLPPSEAAHFALSAFSSFHELLTSAGGDVFDEARRALAAVLLQHQNDGVVQLDAYVHIVTGTRFVLDRSRART